MNDNYDPRKAQKPHRSCHLNEDCITLWPHNVLSACTYNESKAAGELTGFQRDVSDIYVEAEMLLLKKHHDYGPLNISRAPGGALNGLRVRVWDKLARINNLIDSGNQPNNESLEDSWIDLLNYSAIALMVLRNKWPSE